MTRDMLFTGPPPLPRVTHRLNVRTKERTGFIPVFSFFLHIQKRKKKYTHLKRKKKENEKQTEDTQLQRNGGGKLCDSGGTGH